MIQCVGLNPALQRTLTIEHFTPGIVNRVHGAVVESSAGKGIDVARVVHTLGYSALDPTNQLHDIGSDCLWDRVRHGQRPDLDVRRDPSG